MSQSIFYLLFSVLLMALLIGIVIIMMNIIKIRKSNRSGLEKLKEENRPLLNKIKSKLKQQSIEAYTFNKIDAS